MKTDIHLGQDLCIFRRMRNISHKICRENQNTLLSLTFFPDDDDDNNNNNKFNCKWAVTRWQWLLCMYINMKLVTNKFKSGGLHEKHVVATWNVGNHLSICL